MKEFNYTEEQLEYIMSNEYITDTVRKLKNSFYHSNVDEFCDIYDTEMEKINHDALYTIFVEINNRLNKILKITNY